MNNNIVGLLLSYAMIFLVLLIAGILLKFRICSSTITRKIVHIGVSNWWILAMFFFNDYLYPSLGALSFIIINFISYKKHIFKGMEDPQHEKNAGTVYFPISLLIFSILCFGGTMPPYVGALAILIMGYGDGAAAIVGTLRGKHSLSIFGSSKSLEGAAAMFLVSFAVAWIILSIYASGHAIVASLVLASIATVVEFFTPYGMDNISVPVVSGLSYYFIFYQG